VVTAAKPATESILLMAYPNPATDFVQVEFTLARGATTTAVLVDAQGRVVAELFQDYVRAGKSTFRFTTAPLAAGVYVLRLKSHDQPPLTRRLVVVK
jgi:hypothetical protein